MKTKILFAAALFLATDVFAEVTPAKAIELACHRIERLAILKKIEPDFLNHIKTMSIEPFTLPEDPSAKFKVTGLLGDGANSARIEIISNADGKALSHHTFPGDIDKTVIWPDKDSVTLVENSLHHVLDNSGVQPELLPFDQEALSISIAPITEGGVITGSRATMKTTTSSTPNLMIELNAAGEFVSAELSR